MTPYWFALREILARAWLRTLPLLKGKTPYAVLNATLHTPTSKDLYLLKRRNVSSICKEMHFEVNFDCGSVIFIWTVAIR